MRTSATTPGKWFSRSMRTSPVSIATPAARVALLYAMLLLWRSTFIYLAH